MKKGVCFFHDRDLCFFAHPEEDRGAKMPPQQRRQLQHIPRGAGRGAGGAGPAGPGGGQGPAGAPFDKRRRKNPLNRSRAKLLRHFVATRLARHLGPAAPPVLDVAGGKGELGFLLANLDGARVAVLEPRPLETARFRKRLDRGIYHQNDAINGSIAVGLDESRGAAREPEGVPLLLTRELVRAVLSGGGASAEAEAARAMRAAAEFDWSQAEHEGGGGSGAGEGGAPRGVGGLGVRGFVRVWGGGGRGGGGGGFACTDRAAQAGGA